MLMLGRLTREVPTPKTPKLPLFTFQRFGHVDAWALDSRGSEPRNPEASTFRISEVWAC
jgi:hypothetical protein